jgi:uncharacterized protein (DUF2336 family)
MSALPVHILSHGAPTRLDPNHGGLLDELQETLAHGSIARRVNALRQVTDLFLVQAVDYSSTQIGLFDDVFHCLIERIEESAKATLAKRLARVPEAPPRIVRTLAFDDSIDVAGPVLTLSERLDDETLVENARTKGQAHLMAISRRRTLSEVVTDVLTERGNRDVMHSTAANPGAQFSDEGFARLVDRSENDDAIVTALGMQPLIPRHQFIRLLARASRHVRTKLEAQRIEPPEDISGSVEHAALGIQTVTAASTPTMIAAKHTVQELKDAGRLDELRIVGFAHVNRFDEVNAALACLAGVAISTVELMMMESRSEGVLVLSKIIGLNWTTVCAILEMRHDLLETKTLDLNFCKIGYERLKTSTAQQVLRFHRMRQLTEQ